MKREGNIRLILSGLWVALVAAYWVWAAITFSGLYRWLAEWQIAQFGGYYERATATLPAILMAAPAIAYLRRRSAVAQAEAAAQLGPEVAEGAADPALGLGIGRLRPGRHAGRRRRLPAFAKRAGRLRAGRAVRCGHPRQRAASAGPGHDPRRGRSGGQRRHRRNPRRHHPQCGLCRLPPRGRERPRTRRSACSSNARPAAARRRSARASFPIRPASWSKTACPIRRFANSRRAASRWPAPIMSCAPAPSARRDTYYVVAAVAGFLGFVFMLVAGIMAIRAAPCFGGPDGIEEGLVHAKARRARRPSIRR